MSNAKYTIQQVANFFLRKEPMDQKKMQKLCYYAYAWYLFENNTEGNYRNILFPNDIEGWIHGPVSRSLYKTFPYAGLEILHPQSWMGDIPADDLKTVDFLNRVYNVFGGCSGNELERMTHIEAPWQEARQGLQSTEAGRKILRDDTMYRQCAILEAQDEKE